MRLNLRESLVATSKEVVLNGLILRNCPFDHEHLLIDFYARFYEEHTFSKFEGVIGRQQRLYIDGLVNKDKFEGNLRFRNSVNTEHEWQSNFYLYHQGKVVI